MQDEVFDVDAWLEQLEKDKPRQGAGLIKLLMNTRANKGNIIFVPFKDQKSKNFYTKLTGVREFKYYSEQSDADIWHKILPKEIYGTLNEEQSKLYDEVVSRFDSLNESLEDFNILRFRSYTFFYGYVLDHSTENGQSVIDSINKPALIEIPSTKVITAFSDAIQSKSKALKGNSWIPVVLNDNPTDRQGMVSIKISGGKGGYDFTVVLEIQNPIARVIPEDFDATDIKPFFKDAIADYLGWQSGDNGYFNDELFAEMRNQLIILENGGKQTPVQPEQSSEAVQTDPADTTQAPTQFDPRKPF